MGADLRRERIDLVALVDHVVAECGRASEHGGVAIEVGGAAGPLWVEVDPVAMRQALRDLLSQAQGMARGDRVAVAVARDGETVIVEVGGDDPAVRGVDLTGMTRVVEDHGGAVAVCDAAAGGLAAIAVRLPLARPSAAQPVVPAPLPRLDARRVLVIEDHPDTSRALEHALKLLGIEVRVVASGVAAIDVAREFGPHVVLCDIGLPGMDGYEVARMFAADPRLRDIRLVALSGHCMPEDVRRSIAAGFRCHLTKPVSLDDLVQAIAAPL